MAKKLNPAVGHWVQEVKACLSKWRDERNRLGDNDWPYFDLPYDDNKRAPRWDVDMARRQHGGRRATSHNYFVSFVDKANKALDYWDEFAAARVAEVQALLAMPVARGVDSARLRRIHAAVADLQRHPGFLEERDFDSKFRAQNARARASVT